MVTKFLSIAIFTVNGAPDREAMDLEYKKLADEACAKMSTDFDSIKIELNAWLCANPGVTTLAEKVVAGRLWDARIEAGIYKGIDHATRSAEQARMNQVLSDFIRANPAQFHVGKKLGVAFNFADGDHVKNEKTGETLKDSKGEPVQRYRFKQDEWAKMTAPKPSEIPAAAPSAPVSTQVPVDSAA